MDIFRDVVYSLRTLRKNPGVAVTTVLSLGIGIGATTAIFALVNGLLLRPLPGVAEPERLVNVYRQHRGDPHLDYFSSPAYRDYRDSTDMLNGFAVYTDRALSLTRNGESQLVASQIVSGNYFDVLGTRPAQGRFFLPEEDRGSGSHPVAVVSYTFWQRRFGGDPNMVGQTLILNGMPFTVIGIAPRGFGGTFVGFVFDLWIPTAMAPSVLRRSDLEERDNIWLEAVGRLRPGVSLPQAHAALNTVARRLEREHPEDRNFEVVLAPVSGLDEELRGGVIGFLAVLMVVALFLLLIACVNVANMLLARAAARGREIAVRLALGMGRRRLLRQLLTESVVLALLGGAAGLLLASWGVAALRQFELPPGVPLVLDFSLDYRVLGFALLISVLSGLAFGMVPARQAARPELVTALKDASARPGRGSRIRSAFVVGQVAVSLLLLITAGLFLRALQRAASLDPGFDAGRVEVVTLDPSVLGYDASRSSELFQQVGERVATLPGVEAVALASTTPLGLGNLFGGTRISVQVPGQQPPPGQDAFKLESSTVGPGYLDVLRIPLLKGRDFTLADREGTPRVAIVNETMAERFWPGQDPIGQRILYEGQEVRIAGLARDSKYARVNEDPKDFLYLPYAQNLQSRMTLFVRTSGEPSAIAPALRHEIRALAENLPVLNLMTMEDSIAVSRLPQRIAATVATVLGLIGLLLAGVGIYGVVAYSVAQRRREIGIRMALGAHQGTVIRLVLRQGLVLVLSGVAIGGLAAFGLSQLLAGLLFGLNPGDPVTYVGIAALLVLTALMASFLPARRAARTDPTMAFRTG